MSDASASKRSSRYIQSVRARHDLLSAHVNNSAEIDGRLATSCRSQGELAKLEAPDLSIHRMSLNTLKVVSSSYLMGGFEELDRLRRLVAHQHSKNGSNRPHPDENPRERERSDVARLLEQRQKLVDSCAFMADQYNDLLANYRRALDRLDKDRADPANERRLLENHLKRFRGPRAQPLVVIGTEGRDKDE